MLPKRMSMHSIAGSNGHSGDNEASETHGPAGANSNGHSGDKEASETTRASGCELERAFRGARRQSETRGPAGANFERAFGVEQGSIGDTRASGCRTRTGIRGTRKRGNTGSGANSNGHSGDKEASDRHDGDKDLQAKKALTALRRCMALACMISSQPQLPMWCLAVGECRFERAWRLIPLQRRDFRF